MIIGRDLMTELGINLDFFHQKVKWQEAEIPMKMPNCTLNNSFYVQDSELLNSEADRIKQILDAKYEAADLKEIAEDAGHLSEEEKQQLYQLLIKYETLFDGTLGTWKNETLSIAQHLMENTVDVDIFMVGGPSTEDLFHNNNNWLE